MYDLYLRFCDFPIFVPEAFFVVLFKGYLIDFLTGDRDQIIRRLV